MTSCDPWHFWWANRTQNKLMYFLWQIFCALNFVQFHNIETKICLMQDYEKQHSNAPYITVCIQICLINQMQQTCNSCFGSVKRHTILRQAKTGKHECWNITTTFNNNDILIEKLNFGWLRVPRVKFYRDIVLKIRTFPRHFHLFILNKNSF